MSIITLQLSINQTQSPSRVIVGSFDHDRDSGRYQLSWESWAKFEAWRKAEEEEKMIELRRKEVRHPNSGNAWTEKHLFVCTRQGTGGKVNYERKNPHWQRSVESKRVGCICRLTVKTYPTTSQLLGMYQERHSHEIGRN